MARESDCYPQPSSSIDGKLFARQTHFFAIQITQTTMTIQFVSPFMEFDADGTASSVFEAKQARGITFECAQQQGALETCLSDNACDNAYCDVATLSTTTMALDCSASLAWTCVISQQCAPCTEEISILLECVGLVARCNFTDCIDTTASNNNVPAMSPTTGNNAGLREPTIGEATLASIMPSIIDDTFMPTRVSDVTIPLTSPANTSGASGIGHGNSTHGYSVMFGMLGILLLGWR